MAHIAERCGNGNCTRPVYRGRYCFRCWAGVKWTSIIQRVRNSNGKCRSYIGVPVGFTREQFIEWVLNNPPPAGMVVPSIDRIVNKDGYSPGNIRWLERSKNSSGPNRDLLDGLRKCCRCGEVKEATNEYFPRTTQRGKKKLSSMCHPCNRIYQQNWRDNRGASI